MAAREIACSSCGQKVYEVPGHFKPLVVDRGQVEIAYKVTAVGDYTTQAGFRIHKCKKESP